MKLYIVFCLCFLSNLVAFSQRDICFDYNLSGAREHRKICVIEPEKKNSFNNDSISIEADDKKLNISVFPNPTHSLVNVTVTSSKRDQQYYYIMSDLSGRIITKDKLRIGSNLLSLDTLLPGIYIMTVKTKDQLFEWKIIKE
ncbi:MAG: T9SS type A sorting domain-containing protein [Omnitrophica WOR_2 bacterium]